MYLYRKSRFECIIVDYMSHHIYLICLDETNELYKKLYSSSGNTISNDSNCSLSLLK